MLVKRHRHTECLGARTRLSDGVDESHFFYPSIVLQLYQIDISPPCPSWSRPEGVFRGLCGEAHCLLALIGQLTEFTCRGVLDVEVVPLPIDGIAGVRLLGARGPWLLKCASRLLGMGKLLRLAVVVVVLLLGSTEGEVTGLCSLKA